jgi:preprotein translocase subunit SecG
MTTLFLILIILAAVILSLIVLVQNPKGGGLAGNIAGFSNQFMGVKQTNDVLEKGTWIFAAVIGLLCVFSSFFISGTASDGTQLKYNIGGGTPTQQGPLTPQQQQPANGQQQQPANTAPANNAQTPPATTDTNNR